MSKKAIIFSLLALVLFVGILFAIVFMFQVHIVLGIVGIAALSIPITLQYKAIAAASGTFDKLFTRFIIPAILLIAILFLVLYFVLWR